MKTIPFFALILAWAFVAGFSSPPPPMEKQDEFFKPLPSRVKMQREPSDNQAEVDALKNENRMLRDSLGRTQDYTPQIKRQAQAKEAEETTNVIKQDRSGARVLVKLDAVESSVTKKSKAAPRSLVRPDNPAYTIQIGAFGKGKVQSALRLQKTAQERFTNQVVLNNYDPVDKLYRVSVGKFKTRKEASRLRKELMGKFPKHYSQCWVNYIAK